MQLRQGQLGSKAVWNDFGERQRREKMGYASSVEGDLLGVLLSPLIRPTFQVNSGCQKTVTGIILNCGGVWAWKPFSAF